MVPLERKEVETTPRRSTSICFCDLTVSRKTRVAILKADEWLMVSSSSSPLWWQEARSLGSQAWVQLPSLSLTSCVTWNRLHMPSVFPFPPLWNGFYKDKWHSECKNQCSAVQPCRKPTTCLLSTWLLTFVVVVSRLIGNPKAINFPLITTLVWSHKFCYIVFLLLSHSLCIDFLF